MYHKRSNYNRTTVRREVDYPIPWSSCSSGKTVIYNLFKEEKRKENGMGEINFWKNKEYHGTLLYK